MEINIKKARKSMGHLSTAQKTKLVDLMCDRPQLRSGKFTKNFSFKDGQQEWENIADILNSIPGSQKNWRLWRKTWQDLQAKAKSKKAKFNKAVNKTGGGPPPEPINELDEGIVALINNNSVVGHEGVAESLVQDILLEEMNMESPVILPPPDFDSHQENQEQGAEANEVPVTLQPPEFDSHQENQEQRAEANGNKTSTNKKINMKSLLKDKLELKRKLVESTIKFQAEYIRLQEERNRILQGLCTYLST